MSLELMKKRIAQSGISPREEMIIDGQNVLKEELKHDPSYSPTLFLYNTVEKIDDKCANLRVYGRKYSSLNGNYMNFLTSYDNPIKIGNYLHDTKDNTYWLVYNSFNVNDIHYEGKLIQCNYLLKWQLLNGTIVERWANIVSASKYDVGENGNNTLIMPSNNFTVLIGYCEEGFDLEGRRVFIDKKTHKPTKVFKFTRSDDILFDSGDMGSLLSFIADKDNLDMNSDRQDLRLCNYIDVSDTPIQPDNPNEITVLSATINGIKKLKLGLSRTYTATIMDSNGNEIVWDDTFSWDVQADFEVSKIINGNKIELVIEDETLIGSSFLVCVIKDNNVLTQTNVTIVGLA